MCLIHEPTNFFLSFLIQEKLKNRLNCPPAVDHHLLFFLILLSRSLFLLFSFHFSFATALTNSIDVLSIWWTGHDPIGSFSVPESLKSVAALLRISLEPSSIDFSNLSFFVSLVFVSLVRSLTVFVSITGSFVSFSVLLLFFFPFLAQTSFFKKSIENKVFEVLID